MKRSRVLRRVPRACLRSPVVAFAVGVDRHEKGAGLETRTSISRSGSMPPSSPQRSCSLPRCYVSRMKLGPRSIALPVASLLMALTLGWMGCATTSSTPSPSTPPRPRTFAIVSKGRHPYYEPALAGFDAAAKGGGIEVEVVEPPRFEPRLQAEAIERLLEQHVDGIAVAPIDGATVEPLLLRARRSGIALVAFDSPAPSSVPVPFIGVDNLDAGRSAGERLAYALNGPGKIVVLQYGMQAPTLNLRRQGFIEAVARVAPAAQILEVIDTSGDRAVAADRLRDVLGAHPEVTAVFGISADGVPLAVEVLARRPGSGQVIVAGFDDLPPTLEAIRQGTAAFTVVQRTFRMGWLALDCLRQASEGRGVPKVVDVGTMVVTRSNVDGFRSQIEAMVTPCRWGAKLR